MSIYSEYFIRLFVQFILIAFFPLLPFLCHFSGSLVSKKSTMTDAERDQIDYEAHVFMKKCNELLGKYKNDCKCLNFN